MSPSAATEPTTFALDLYYAAGAQGDPALAAHVAGCARCTAYLAALAALAHDPPPLAAARPRARGQTRWLVAAGAFASACAAVTLWLSTADDYVGSKGLPAVQALIRSAGQAHVWDGKTPLRSGDAIALRTSCDRFSRVAVAVAAKDGPWKRLFDGACSEREPLPFTLVADDKPGSEQVEIVFSRTPLTDAALQRAITHNERTDTTWVITLVLPKGGAAR